MKIQDLFIRYFRARLKLLALFSKKQAGHKAFQIFCTPHFSTVYDVKQMRHATNLSFDFNNLTITGHQWNKGGSKKLLMVHGFRSASANFKHFTEKLSAKGYEVLAFDAPAHGLSKGKTLNALVYKNFVHAVNEHFGPFDAYLAHSFGGLAVSLHLEEIPDNTRIKTVLIAPAANTQQLCEDFLREMRIKDPLVQQHFYDKIRHLSNKNIEWFSINRAANRIKGEVLWVHDTGDKVTPVDDALQLQQKHLPNFHFLFTSSLGHRRIYRDENVVSAIINFL
jgi:pimeloyl-ACP methyl ester carboxylesterase